MATALYSIPDSYPVLSTNCLPVVSRSIGLTVFLCARSDLILYFFGLIALALIPSISLRSHPIYVYLSRCKQIVLMTLPAASRYPPTPLIRSLPTASQYSQLVTNSDSVSNQLVRQVESKQPTNPINQYSAYGRPILAKTAKTTSTANTIYTVKDIPAPQPTVLPGSG